MFEIFVRQPEQAFPTSSFQIHGFVDK